MSTKLLFAQSSPLDTTVIYETTGHPLYEIETETSTIQKVTVVRKLDLNHRGEDNLAHSNEEIARIHWNIIVPDEVVFQGRRMTKDKFIHRLGSGSEVCHIMQAQGVEYRWIRRDPNSPSLVKSDHEETFIARLHRPAPSPLDIKDAFLEVTPDGHMILDHVLVSFIFIEKEFRDKDKSPRRSPVPLQ